MLLARRADESPEPEDGERAPSAWREVVGMAWSTARCDACAERIESGITRSRWRERSARKIGA